MWLKRYIGGAALLCLQAFILPAARVFVSLFPRVTPWLDNTQYDPSLSFGKSKSLLLAGMNPYPFVSLPFLVQSILSFPFFVGKELRTFRSTPTSK